MHYPHDTRAPRVFPLVGARVRQLRGSYKITQAELARRARLPISVVNELENGVTRNPRIATVLSLALALHVSPDHLLTGLDPHQMHRAGMVCIKPCVKAS
jgi:transcriptional regulator with XRE-family HTH domain